MKFFKNLIFFFVPYLVVAQAIAQETKTTNLDFHHHEHKKWEFGTALGVVPILNEDEVSWGIHAHLLRSMESIKRLKIGFGLENIFDEHAHINTSAVFNYQISQGFSASYSPGILFFKENSKWEKYFSSHFEFLYEFEIGNYHLGPIVEYSYAKVDQHLMFGIHFAFGF
ncbi:MAG: hypothetical protein KBD63_07330 [Bacteriovoracaceae bacterium]|nr:hypothetical protein [Bacteriovoracaceae bacterium]